MFLQRILCFFHLLLERILLSAHWLVVVSTGNTHTLSGNMKSCSKRLMVDEWPPFNKLEVALVKICFNKMMSLEHMSYLPERQQDDYFCTTKSQFVIGSKSVHLFCRDPNKLCVCARGRDEPRAWLCCLKWLEKSSLWWNLFIFLMAYQLSWLPDLMNNGRPLGLSLNPSRHVASKYLLYTLLKTWHDSAAAIMKVPLCLQIQEYILI